MYNPLAHISPPLMQALIKEPKLFVREYYPRGRDHFDAPDNVPLLFTYYEKSSDVEVNRAGFHLQQLEQDPYRFLYDSENPAHVQRLLKAAEQPAPYTCFINLLPKAWEPPLALRTKVHAYMLHHLPWWNYSKSNSLHIHLKDRYGKLYLQLSWKANRTEVLLDEVENCKVCAMT